MRWLILIMLGLVSVVTYASYPTGISAHNGPIFTNAVLGFVAIQSLLAYNSSFTSCPYGASVQLNVVLQVNTTSGTYYYWLQDVGSFLTNMSEMNFCDNVWNSTAPYANITQIQGYGSIYQATYNVNGGHINVSFYAYGTNFIYYEPLYSFYLLINESYNSSGVKVSFGYLILTNDSKPIPPQLVIYDNVFIPVKGITSASIIINDSYTPWGGLKDAELVWGGYAGGEHTTFLNMSSWLALYYNENNQWRSFNLVYTYGNDTAESADNLHVTISHGFAYVTTGTPNPTSFTVNFVPPYLTYVNITSPVPFYINGTLVNKTTIAGYVDEPITIQFIKNYTANSSAFAILSGPQTFTIYPSDLLPTQYYIKANYTWYYLVNVYTPVPVKALVNGIKEQLKSGYYPEGTIIEIYNQTYYYSPTHRVIITPKTITINSPTNITVTGTTQYYVNVSSPVPVYALVNGSNETLTSGWFNANTTIQIFNQTYYYSSTHRFIVKPMTVTVTSPTNITITGVTQYYLNVSSPIPIYALVDGKNETLNSGWYNANTSINVENITYYPENGERYVIVSVSPSFTFTFNSSISLNVKVVKQYLVTIQSSYPVTINGVTTNQEWVNAGSAITLNANLPFYLTGSFTGTENVPLGGSIVVNQPVNETLTASVSIEFIALILVIVLVVIGAVVLAKKK